MIPGLIILAALSVGAGEDVDNGIIESQTDDPTEWRSIPAARLSDQDKARHCCWDPRHDNPYSAWCETPSACYDGRGACYSRHFGEDQARGALSCKAVR